MNFDPAVFAIRPHDAEFNRLGVRAAPVLEVMIQAGAVVRMAHGPGTGSRPRVRRRLTEDVGDLRRRPDGVTDQVDVQDPHPGGVQGELQPPGVVLRLPAGFEQRRDLDGVDGIKRRRAGGIGIGPVLAMEPAGAAAGIDESFAFIEQMLAALGPPVHVEHVVRQVGDHVLQSLAQIGFAGEAPRLFPRLARGEHAAVKIEQGGAARRSAEGRAGHLDQVAPGLRAPAGPSGVSPIP